MENTQDHTRRKFLGTVGKTAAAAIGVTLLSTRAATAGEPTTRPKASMGRQSPNASVNWTCCVSTCKSCGSGLVAYHCSSNTQGCTPYCSGCIRSKGTCYSYQTAGC